MRPGQRFNPEGMRHWASKAQGRAARIAALLHLAEHAGRDPMPVQISETTMEQAIELTRYYAGVAEAMMATSDPDRRDLEQVIAFLQRRKEYTAPFRDLYRKLSHQKRGRTPKAWEPVVALGVRLGVLQTTVVNTSGKPALWVELNPTLWGSE
jgi:hypothetical protein